MTTPETQGKGLQDQIGRESETLSERVAVLQNKVKALGLTATLSVSDVKAFMDDQWGDGDHSNHG